MARRTRRVGAYRKEGTVRSKLRARFCAEMRRLGAMDYPVAADFLGERVIVLGPVHRFPPYDDPAYGTPRNPTCDGRNMQQMVARADGSRFIAFATQLRSGGSRFIERLPSSRVTPRLPFEPGTQRYVWLPKRQRAPRS